MRAAQLINMSCMVSLVLVVNMSIAYPCATTHPLWSFHVDALRVVDGNVSPGKPPQGGFAVSGPRNPRFT
jgi:hypothetical protein